MLRFYTAGESHGRALVTIIEGLPAGLPVDVEFLNHQLYRRQLGYGRGGRQKIETDRVQILSGVRHGETFGSPIAIVMENKDFANWEDIMAVEPRELDEAKARRLTRPRPGHADLAGGLKYDRRDLRDILERASARETAARVAVGAFAQLLLKQFRMGVASHTLMLGGIPEELPLDVPWDTIVAIPDDSPLRCADTQAEQLMVTKIDEAWKAGDTLGGVFEVVAQNVPVGLGSHTQWDLKLDGRLAQAVMSIQAVKAVEIGLGASISGWPGSQVQDEIFYNPATRQFYRTTNTSGGLEGGITTGSDVRVRGHLKPLSTLRQPLMSVNIHTKEPEKGHFERSDVTSVPAAGVVGEAMVAIVLAQAMREKFGGDSLNEMKRNVDGYMEQVRAY
jgi:chorismate synthase